MLAKWKQAEERWGTEGPGPWSLHFVLGVWAVEAVERGTGLRRQWAASFTSWCGVFPRGLGSWVFSPLPVSEPSSQFNCWGGQEGAHWNLPWGGIKLYRKGWMLRMRSIYPGLEGAWQQQCGQRDKQGAGTTPKAPGISLSHLFPQIFWQHS